METQSLSNREIREKFPACENLTQVIRQYESSLTKQGKVICRISVNGMLFTENDEERLGLAAIGEIQELSVQIRPIKSLASETQATVLEWIPKLHESAVQTAEALRVRNGQMEKQLFISVVRGAHLLVEALTLLKSHIVGEGRAVSLESWTASEAQLGRIVRELVAAFEKSDFVLICDLLEYELTLSLDKWRETLSVDTAK